jgi:hypothetical protein
VRQRTRRQIIVFAVLLVKLLAMDFAVLPMAHAAARVETVAAPVAHCAEMATEAGVHMRHGATLDAAASAEADEAATLDASGAHARPAVARDTPSNDGHHGCHSALCKCSCAHAPADVAAVTVAVTFAPRADVPALDSSAPAIGGVSVLFRPPI